MMMTTTTRWWETRPPKEEHGMPVDVTDDVRHYHQYVHYFGYRTACDFHCCNFPHWYLS
jgi:hypothetical protein